jgi:menaquinone-dependent protoporphyrinogen IX oxidase
VKALVVYYSNSGTTSLVAERIARQLGADVEGIREAKPRPALLVEGTKPAAGGGAMAKAVLASMLGLGSSIQEGIHDPSQYDVVVIGTPVWGGSLTPAVRSYLKRHRKALRTVAFFCSAGDPSKLRAFNQMRELAGKAPVATLAVKSDDARADTCGSAVEDFIAQITRA